jgi:flagellar biosynthetic protein FliP
MHLAEMIAAMVAGMVVLGGALEGLLALAGASLSHASAPLAATVMAFNMTAPMVLWMRYRGHPSRHSAEMAASMIVPTAVVIGLYAVSAIASGTVLLAQHVVMIPAMVAVMLWRYDHYSR